MISPMKIAMIGLGKMGGNMVRRLMRGGHNVVAFDRNPEMVKAFAAEGAIAADSLEDTAVKARADGQPAVVWVMVPAGGPTEDTLKALAAVMQAGDIVIDGGNSNFKDSQRHALEMASHKLEFIDCGTSGGIWGLENGYCLMTGGTVEAHAICQPIFTTLAPPEGHLHAGPAGAGHFTKMIHNGIEYGLMQAYAEGFEILEKSPFNLDLQAVAALWGKGSVVRSWLLELLERAFESEARLETIAPYVEDSGEGRWTVQTALEYNVPAPIITLSLLERLDSRQEVSFSHKVTAALRNQFGGHAVKHSVVNSAVNAESKK
jgi:6-phosphogluconate dehydrogenase